MCRGRAILPYMKVTSAVLSALPLAALFRPSSTGNDHAPLAILLHGYGSNEEDLFPLAYALPGEIAVLSVRAPLSMGPDMFAWFPLTNVGEGLGYAPPDLLIARKTFAKFLKAVQRNIVKKTTPIVLIGFSQGGGLAYDAAFSGSSTVGGVAMLSGLLLTETRELLTKQKISTMIPLFMGHGTGDTVLPVRHSRAAKKFLEHMGYTPMYKEYSMGHSISPAEIHDLADWLTNLSFKTNDRDVV